MESVSFSAKAEKQKVTREQALRVARQLGCRGAHQHDDGGWMPCNSHDEFVAIRESKNEYYKISAQQRFEVGSEIEHRVKRLESKSNAYYENRADALSISKIRGCGGVRTVMLAGKKYYTPCDHKPSKDWEKLDESPITGIATLPSGGLVTGSFSGKSLGRPIGGVSDVDGDGDGFTSNVVGEDIVPVVAKKPIQAVLQHSGTEYLKEFRRQREEQEKTHGDLSSAENAERALRKNFPNLRTVNLFDKNQKVLSPLQIAHTVSLLHLSSQNPKIAKNIHRFDGLFFEEYPDYKWTPSTTAAATAHWVGVKDSSKGKVTFEHSILFNKDVKNFEGKGNFLGWGDVVAKKMLSEGASQDEVDTFWGMYVLNHEWSHAEHNVATWEQLGIDMNSESTGIIKKILVRSGMSEKQVNDLIESLKLQQKRINANLSEVELEIKTLQALYQLKWDVIKDVIGEAKFDDLKSNELATLQKGYPATVSMYATDNFNELVAEKASAARMGHPAGAPNNPAWRKFHGWLNSTPTNQMNPQNMTRQQRRQAERQAKKSDEDDSFLDLVSEKPYVTDDIFFAVLDRCTGFPHLKFSKQKTSVEQKGFVNFVSRSTDPDTFSNPDSARVRARNLGCIGIRRYTASDGKLVWLPCSNVSDYNRVTGIRGDNSPRNNPRRQGSKFGKKVLGTPIGGVSNEDGDGDGFTTRGIPGAPDNIPVAPKPKKSPPEPFTGLKPYSDYFKKSSKLKKDFEKHIQERVKKGDSKEMILFRIALFNRNKPQYVNHWSKLRPKLMNFYYEKYSSGMGWQALNILKDPDVPRGPGRPRKKGISAGIISLKTALRPKRKNPTIDSDAVNMLAIKVRQHNANVSQPSYKTNLRDVKVVYLRGLSAGDEKTALKRVNNFLRAMASDTPLPKGQRQDFDIIPETHPSKDKKTAKKDGSFDDGEFGIKYKSACCPQLVKRHKKL